MSTTTSSRPDDQLVPVAARPATTKPPFPHTWVLKVCMAVTGSVFVGFVVFHMAGNLKVFLGPEDFNKYAAWLRTIFNPLVPGDTVLWIFRIVLFASLVIHVYSGSVLAIRGRKARGKFRRKGMGMKRIAPRTMIWTGLIILCFVIFHILDLTIGQAPAASSEFEHGNAYANLVYSFQRPAVAIFYMLTMLLLAAHIAHGMWSVLNDFGGTGKRLRKIWMPLAGLVAFVVALGNVMIPLAVLCGWVAI